MRLPSLANSKPLPASCCDKSSTTENLPARVSKSSHLVQPFQMRVANVKQLLARVRRENDLRFHSTMNSRSMQQHATLCPRSLQATVPTADRRAPGPSTTAQPRKRVLQSWPRRCNQTQASYRKR